MVLAPTERMKLATSPPPENPRLGPAIVAPERTEEVQPTQRAGADNARVSCVG